MILLQEKPAVDTAGTGEWNAATVEANITASRGKGREMLGICDNLACGVTCKFRNYRNLMIPTYRSAAKHTAHPKLPLLAASKQWRKGPLVCPRLCNACGTRFNRSKEGKEQAFFVWVGRRLRYAMLQRVKLSYVEHNQTWTATVYLCAPCTQGAVVIAKQIQNQLPSNCVTNAYQHTSPVCVSEMSLEPLSKILSGKHRHANNSCKSAFLQ